MKRLLPILTLFLLLCSCERESYVARVTDLRLVSVDPKNGYPGDLVTLLGRNFSTVPEENHVTIGGAETYVLEAYKDRLLLILPDNVPGQYSISVEAPSGKAEGLSINYLKIPDKEYLVTTVVGQQGVRKCIDGVGTGAATYMPTGINRMADGTLLFTDRGGNKIRHIAADLTVTCVASVDTPGAAVWQGAFDGKGNYWYNDKANGNLYRYSLSDGKNTLISGGMKSPMNVAFDAEGNMYVPARDDKVVYKFTPPSWERSVFAEIPEDGPAFIGFDPKGNLIASVQHGYRLISIAPDGTQTVIMGTGEKSSEMVDSPEGNPLETTVRSCQGFDFDSEGNLYVGDATYNCVRKLGPDANGDYSKGKVETILGGVKGYADGKGLNTKFNEVDGILVYDDATLYICDSQNCLIRKVSIR